MQENPKVFVSYSHVDEVYENKVLDFVNKLRTEGIDANVDLYEESPDEGWPRWMDNQLRIADYVLVICSKSYFEKCYTDKSKGVSWEVNIVFQYIYDNNSENKKIIPVIFNESDVDYISAPLKSFTYYNIGTNRGYVKLYWRLRGVTKTQRPPLGTLRPLPQKERKTMFFSTPIDLDKWDKAGWKGMLYMFYEDSCPVLGILYKNYSVAKDIFSVWKKDAANSFADKFLSVDYIVPPYPKDCWVYSDKERSYGKGYFVHIGPNVEKSINRAFNAGIQPSELFLATVSRYQWMDEINGSNNRELFKKLIEDNTSYLLMPIGVKDSKKPIEEKNLIIDFNYAVKMKQARFQAGIDVKDDDTCKVVLKKS